MAFTLTMTSPELLAVVGEKDPSRCVKDVMEEKNKGSWRDRSMVKNIHHYPEDQSFIPRT